jgi:hypothetical protein
MGKTQQSQGCVFRAVKDPFEHSPDFWPACLDIVISAKDAVVMDYLYRQVTE